MAAKDYLSEHLEILTQELAVSKITIQGQFELVEEDLRTATALLRLWIVGGAEQAAWLNDLRLKP